MTARPYIAPKTRAKKAKQAEAMTSLRTAIAIASIAVPTFAASWFAAALLSGWAA